MKTFSEWFAGIGLVRAGLENSGWTCTYANDIDVPILSLAFSWLLSHPRVPSVIAGASSPEQIRANVAAITVLSDEQLKELERLSA